MKKLLSAFILLNAMFFCSPAYSGGADIKQPTIFTSDSITIGLFHYVPKILFELKWGDKKNEVGYKIMEEFGVIGPTRIAVDKFGNIHIFDGIKRRVLKYTQDGKLMDIINLDLPEDYMYDNDAIHNPFVDSLGYIYWEDNILPRMCYIFDKNGKLVRRVIEKSDVDEFISLQEMFVKEETEILTQRKDAKAKGIDDRKLSKDYRYKSKIEILENDLQRHQQYYAKLTSFYNDSGVTLSDGSGLQVDLNDEVISYGPFIVNRGKAYPISDSMTLNNGSFIINDLYCESIVKWAKVDSLVINKRSIISLSKYGLFNLTYIAADGNIYAIVRLYNKNYLELPIVNVVKWERVK